MSLIEVLGFTDKTQKKRSTPSLPDESLQGQLIELGSDLKSLSPSRTSPKNVVAEMASANEFKRLQRERNRNWLIV